ncbi:MAG TPA: type I DNA topoisomerase [Microthrixaceae bacterium]|nr:type I DNA topoisomerase [Microthrixaceae bacterium]
MGQPLVIVESPAKARTISRFLGDEYVVESSVGHIRDLPSKAAEVPAAYKGTVLAKLGVDPDDGFKPLYIVSPNKKEQVKRLKDLLKDADELYLATDEDREGEAIAWHLLEVLKPKVPVRRMVFHEITPDAIQSAIENPRDLNRSLVDAQEARRIFDRLYGYEVSPVLWKKVMPRLSAGRVQSVATRIVVERERERMRFRTASYWDLSATFQLTGAGKDTTPFGANLIEVDSLRVATGRDFDETGSLTRDGAVLLDEESAGALRAALEGRPATIASVERKPYTRKPYAPFMTSTLQQEAGRKLRFSSSQTMSLAQRLYENGFITYMRTDSTTLSETAINAARSLIASKYGEAYLPDSPRVYAKKSKNAQEAHEAIRPAGDTFRSPEEVRSVLGTQEFRLYELIWQRTIASQMTDARGESMQVRIDVDASDGRRARFAASGKTILFPGFLRAYVEGADDPDAELEDQERILPDMAEGDGARSTELDAKGHETQPPARYTEASLVKRLEELGIGRPSTYASTISTIQDRGYVRKKGSALVPSFTAFAVVTLLEQHFPDLVDYALTAHMEDDLDRIATGDASSAPWLSSFYFGDGVDSDRPGLKHMVTDIEHIDARAVNSIPIGADANGELIVARVGRYGAYIQRGDDTANIPDDHAPDELTPDKAVELLNTPKERKLGDDPATGKPIYVKNGRFGPYVQLGDHDDETGEKPKMASLFQTMTLERVSLDDALELLSLPRVLGVDPADGVEITAQNGKFGPYIKKDTDSRTIENEEMLLTITLDEALRILAEPKRRRGQAVKGPLKDLGKDPDSERPILCKDGRFGPYVTDGITNASLRKGDSVEELTIERAMELLADRREKDIAAGKDPAKKASARKAPAKKAGAKKTAAKKAPAKKTAAKKAPAKKAAAKKSPTAAVTPKAVADAFIAADGDEPF